MNKLHDGIMFSFMINTLVKSFEPLVHLVLAFGISYTYDHIFYYVEAIILYWDYHVHENINNICLCCHFSLQPLASLLVLLRC